MRTSDQPGDFRYERAKARVVKLRGFYTHLAIYMVFVLIFILLNFVSGGFPWAIFPILGWGLGVLGHATDTFSWNPFLDKEWEHRKIREYMDQEDNMFN